MFSGQNLWVLKPNDFNRGRGIHIFNKLDDVKKLITDYITFESPFSGVQYYP